MTQKQLEGKVAGIINERELAINIGTVHGVKEGMMFKVLAEKPTEIYDPETQVLLGVIDREKVRVKVNEVHEKFSVCRTYQQTMIGNINIASFLEPRRSVPETLRADKSAYIPALSEEESYVKKGDRVVEIIEEE